MGQRVVERSEMRQFTGYIDWIQNSCSVPPREFGYTDPRAHAGGQTDAEGHGGADHRDARVARDGQDAAVTAAKLLLRGRPCRRWTIYGLAECYRGFTFELAALFKGDFVQTPIACAVPHLHFGVERQQKLRVPNSKGCVVCRLFEIAEADMNRNLIRRDLKPQEIEGVVIRPDRALVSDYGLQMIMTDCKIALFERHLKIIAEGLVPILIKNSRILKRSNTP